MKSLTALLACVVVSSCFAADLARFEKQLRSDLYAILKTRWSAQKVADAGAAYADKWLLDLKSAYPELLPDEAEPRVPTEPYLMMLLDEASQHRLPKPKGEIWHYYYEKWRTRVLSPDQRILFERFLNVVILEAKRSSPSGAEIQRFDPEIQRLEAELQRLKERANKAPEPTPGSVTPRATEGKSK